jgi:hypothetical protein
MSTYPFFIYEETYYLWIYSCFYIGNNISHKVQKIMSPLKFFHSYHFDKSYFRYVYVLQLINGYVHKRKVLFWMWELTTLGSRLDFPDTYIYTYIAGIHAYSCFISFYRINPGVFVIWSPINCMSSVRLLAQSLQGIMFFPCKIAKINILS